MQRLSIESIAVGDLHDAAKIHHRNPIGDVLDHCQIVGNKEQSQVEFGLELCQEVEDLGLDRDVESRHRLIGDNQSRPQDESTGNAYPLTLTTRELVRIAGRMGRLETDQIQHLGHPKMTFIS